MKKIIFISMVIIITMQTSSARVSCKQFKNYADAKTYLDAKKPGYKSLDRNHDGIPCQKLYNASLKKSQSKFKIRIYKYGHPNSFGQTYSNLKKCNKAKIKLTKSHIGSDYSYKCEEI